MSQEILIKKIFKLYPWLIFSFFLVFIIINFCYSVFYPTFVGERKIVSIVPNSKIWLIAQNLEKEKIIRSSFYFKFLINFKKSNIKAGIYEFNGFYNMIDVINILENGGRGVKIVITEGMTLKEIENLFRKNNFKVDLSKYKLADFPEVDLKNHFSNETSLEGFLAPDSYEFFPNDHEKTIIKKILDNFSNKFLPELLKGTDLNLKERIILASIVEKEAKFKEDFPIIAGILIKRLKNNKTLDVDASLIYEKCSFVFCQQKLTKEDLRKVTPYNTYKNLGLPPTPISNPGILAIKSVNNYINTDYWYYLTDKSGKAIFAKTLKEHEENIKKFLR